MVDKFSVLSKKFQAMYNQGEPYEEITRELGINVLTIQKWREKLGLPPRRNRNPRSWMDVRTVKGHTPREILQSVAKPLGITEHDIEFILTRVDKLKTKGFIRGRRYEHIILAAAFMYLRWEGSGRRPVSTTKFVEVCMDFNLSRSALHQICRLFTNAGLFPKDHLRPETLLERTWRSLQQEHVLPETLKTRILALIQKVCAHSKLAGHAPNTSTIVAACVYVACVESGHSITQGELDRFFGVTEVSIRNGIKILKEIEPSLKAILGEGDEL